MNRRTILLLLSGSFFLYAIGSGQLPLLGPDEPRYSQVAREMLDRGDFITPTLAGRPWFEKPVLLYWLQGASYSLFGVNEWAARFPSMLAALFTVWIITWTVWRFTRKEPALLAGIVLSTCLFFIAFGRAATFDMLLTACVTASLCCFLLHEQEPHRNWLWLAYIAAGASVLAKGFVGLLIIGLAMLSYLVVSGNLRQLRKFKPVSGSLVALAVAAVWLLPVTLIHGFRFWNDFFLEHHLMRYTTSQFHRSEGFLFYFPIFLLGSYPWTPALFLRSNAFRGAQPLRKMAWCWLLSTFIFFSLSQSKLPGYILPLMPAFAVIAGLSLYEAQRSLRRTSASFVLLHSALIIALVLGSGKFSVPAGPIQAVAIVTAVMAAAGLALFVTNRGTKAFAVNALIPVAALSIGLLGVYPASNWDESRNLAIAVNPELNGEAGLLLYNVYNFPLVFYTNARVNLTSDGYFPPVRSDRDLYRYLQRHGTAYLVVANEELEWMQTERRLRIHNVLKGPEHSIALVTLR